MFVPLSFSEDGTSFEVPADLEGAGWLVLRKSAEGRGRPAVVHHRNGKPLVIPLGSTHDDLLGAAGKGRYRLQIVDQFGRKVEGVPAAHTGMLGVTAFPMGDAEEYEASLDEGDDGYPLGASPVAAPRRTTSSDTSIVVHNMCAMFGQVVGQMVPMMNACTELVTTVSRVGLLGRAAVEHDEPAPVAAPPPPAPAGDASVLQTLMSTVMPMVNQLCMALMMKNTAPVAPTPAPVAPAPVAPVAAMPPRPAAMPPRHAPVSPVPPVPSAAPTHAHAVASVPFAPVSSAGAVPSDGAAPAEVSAEMQMRIGMQLRSVLAELTIDEQQRAAQLVAGLPIKTRSALLVELLQLSIPEAVARARAILANPAVLTGPATGTTPAGTLGA